jgi:hypothetical protein
MLICACRANRRAWEGLTETWQGPGVEEQAGVVPASPPAWGRACPRTRPRHCWAGQAGHGRTGRRSMTHAAVVSAGLYWFLVS